MAVGRCQLDERLEEESPGFCETAELFLERTRALQIETLALSSCREISLVLAEVAKVAKGAMALCAARLTGTTGEKELIGSLAKVGGMSLSGTRRAVRLAGELPATPKLKDAVSSGEVSLAQAEVLFPVLEQVQGSEEQLIEQVSKQSLTATRRELSWFVKEHFGNEMLRSHQHRCRRASWMRDHFGLVHLDADLPAYPGALIMKELDQLTEAIYHDSPSASYDQCRADALMALLQRTDQGKKPRVDLVVVVELPTWLRKKAEPDDICELLGVGPIDPALARELAGKDPYLSLLAHDGRRFHLGIHYGRKIPEILRLALQIGDPRAPRACCASCGAEQFLELDHKVPLASGETSDYDNLQLLCSACHKTKTHSEQASGRYGPYLGQRGSPPSRPSPSHFQGPHRDHLFPPAGQDQVSRPAPPTRQDPPRRATAPPPGSSIPIPGVLAGMEGDSG